MFEIGKINFSEAYAQNKINVDPAEIPVVERTVQGTRLNFAYRPTRADREKRSAFDGHAGCPLCQDALTVGLINPASRADSFAVTHNRFPGMNREVLLVKQTHTAEPLGSKYVREIVAEAVESEVSILYSNTKKSLPAHDHTLATDQSLPIVDETELLHLKDNIYLNKSYPAAAFVIKGEIEERTEGTLGILHKLTDQEIDYNLIATSGAVYIHPIKTLNPFGNRTVGPREAAGIIGTSDKELFDEFSTTDLGYQLLAEASFSRTELKNVFANETYSFDEFEGDAKRMAELIKEIESSEQIQVSHILGVTRGGIALASVLMQRLSVGSISLAGCYIEQTAVGEDVPVWKTEVTSDIPGEAIVLTTDLIRSGKIIKSVIEQAQERNPKIKRVIAVGSHHFKSHEAVAPDVVAHVYPIDSFVSYPWEPSPVDGNSVSVFEEPQQYDSLTDFNRRAITLANEIRETLEISDESNPAAIAGFGSSGIMGVAILSQHLGIRNISGHAKVDADNTAVVENITNQLLKDSNKNRVGNDNITRFVMCVDSMGVDQQEDQELDSFLMNLEASFAERNPTNQLQILVVSFDTSTDSSYSQEKKQLPWAKN